MGKRSQELRRDMADCEFGDFIDGTFEALGDYNLIKVVKMRWE